MKPSSQSRTSLCLASAVLLLAACGGGSGEAPPPAPGAAVDATGPVVTITDSVVDGTATGDVTFTIVFNEDVGTSFTVDDVTVTGGTKGTFTRVNGTRATLLVTPTPNSNGTVLISVAANAALDALGNGNALTTSQQAFNTVVPPPVTGTVVLANFDGVTPTAAGFEGAEGSAIETGPAGGGSGRSFKLLRSGGQVFALGIIETTVPITATRRTVSAQVYSPTAGIPMILKLEGPGGANTGDVAANEAVVVGWQTLTWTFTTADPARTYNKIVLLPNLGTVDAPPGKAYYFDSIILQGVAPPPPPPATGTVLANFDDVTPTAAGFEGAEGSAIETGPAGGGSGRSFKLLRSGGQVFALGIIETTVPITATRRTVSAQVYSPTAGIPMILKLEGPGGANTGDVAANEAVVVGWQTLTWTFTTADPARTYNKIVLLPNLGTVDAPPGKSYYFDDLKLLDAGAGGGGGGGGTPGTELGAGGPQTLTIATGDVKTGDGGNTMFVAGEGLFAVNVVGSAEAFAPFNLAAWPNAKTANFAGITGISGGDIGYFQDDANLSNSTQKVDEGGWVAGTALSPNGVPSFFRFFVLKGPVSNAAYMGLYANAPNNGTVNVSAFSKIHGHFAQGFIAIGRVHLVAALVAL